MIRRTKPRKGDDREYRNWILSLPCVVCVVRGLFGDISNEATPGCVSRLFSLWGNKSNRSGPTEVAHVGERGIGQKCPDKQAIPLCTGHHRSWQQGGRDDSYHKLGKLFWEHHHLDRETLIAELNELYAKGKI